MAVDIVRSSSPLTTKGDIYVRDSLTGVRLPVGTDGRVLAADSTTSTGLIWKDPAVNPFKSLSITISATYQIPSGLSDATYYYINPASSTQTVLLPATPLVDSFRYIALSGSGTLLVKETLAGPTIATLNASTKVAQAHYSSSIWQVVVLGTI